MNAASEPIIDMKPFETETINITPKIARAYLERDHALREEGKNEAFQRFLTGGKVSQYREDYRNGKWRKTHQGMLITDHGEILDGQHRLEAIAGLDTGSFSTLVSICDHRDAKELMLTIDAGKPRDVATQIWLTFGTENARPLVAAVRTQAILVAGVYKHGALSSAQIIQAIDYHRHALETIVSIMTANGGRKAPSAVCAPLALYATFAKAKAIEFAESYVSLENLGATSPILWLKRGFEKYAKTKIGWHKVGRNSIMAANAIQAYDEGKRMSELPNPKDETGRLWLISKARPVCQFLGQLVEAASATRDLIRKERKAHRDAKARITRAVNQLELVEANN